MGRRPERDNRPFWIVLTLALLLCAGFVFVHRAAARQGRPDPILGGARDLVLVPVQTGFTRTARWWRNAVPPLFAGPRLARENTRLQAETLALRDQVTQLQAARAENDRLRLALGFQRRSSRKLLAAEVLTLKPSSQTDTLTLNRGSRDHVHSRTVVLAPNGAVVGQVLEASPFSCTVLMVSDPGSGVSAQITDRVAPGALPPLGICSGSDSGLLRLIDLPQTALVKPGDTVTTSGQGGVYPMGLPLGKVVSVTKDKARSLQTALVRPAADFNHLDTAFLLPDNTYSPPAPNNGGAVRTPTPPLLGAGGQTPGAAP